MRESAPRGPCACRGSHRREPLPTDSAGQPTTAADICGGERLSARLLQTCPDPLSVPGGQGSRRCHRGMRTMQGFVSNNRSSNAITQPRMSTYEPDHVIPVQLEGPDGVRQLRQSASLSPNPRVQRLRLWMAGSMPSA
jgi:hypothetical protein